MVFSDMQRGGVFGAWRRRFLLLAACALVLAGCAGSRAFREGNALLAEGQYAQGLAKLEEATRIEPSNAEYRIALATRRNAVMTQLITTAETARREGRLADAERIYRQILDLDPNYQMAHQGLEALVTARRHRQVVAEAEALFKKEGDASWADAMEKLRPVLSENPNQKEALNLKARLNEARVRALRPEAKLAAAYRKPITLEFRDAPLKSVFDVIAKVSGLNFFFDKDLRPDVKASILAKKTSIEDAVRLLLVTNQLEQKILNENSILIYPATPQKLKDYQTLSVRTFYLVNADVKAVSNTIKTIVKTRDMVVDERLGLIILRDTPEAIRMAERIVALQDLSDPEVMLEVEVMEIKRTRLLELGVQWPTQLTLTPLQTEGKPFTLNDLFHLNSRTTGATIDSAIINARKEDQDANLLTNPRIRVRNKEKAKIMIGDRVPVITTTSTSTGFVSESVNYVDVGLKLEVEPNIYLDEEVAIKVNLEVSSLVREIVSKSGTLSYQIGTRSATTVLRLKDGETQILAGLISDEDRRSANKVPALGEFPLIGRLFGSQKDDTARSEILLAITPHVLRSLRRPDLLEAEFESGTETTVGASSLRLAMSAEAESDAGHKGAGAQAAPSPAPSAASVPTPEPVATVSGKVALAWQAPAQIKAGEQFSAVLKVSSQGALRGLPLLVGFDTQALQVVSVQEGDFFRQANGQTAFNQRTDPAQGKVFVSVVRQNPSGKDAGVNGTGSVVTITFKALKAGTVAKFQLLSVTPEPPLDTPVAVPVESSVSIVQ